MSKIFLMNPLPAFDDEKAKKIKQEKEKLYNDAYTKSRQADISKLKENDNLSYVHNRVIIKIDLDSKDSWTFADGTQINYSRRFNNFNLRETNPVNCIVISAEGIPKDTEILIHPNGIHDSNRVFNYKTDIGNIRYYSIPKEMCFAWLDGKEWQPIAPFDFALRVFQPYNGILQGIDPTIIKDVLYVTTGELKGKVVKTLRACDYIIVFQDTTGREGQLLRFRPFGDPEKKMEEETIAVMNDLTEQVENGELLVGINLKDAKTINEYANV